MPHFLRIAVLCLAISVTCWGDSRENPWSKVQNPTQSPPESIGDYAAGCLRGATTLENPGEGYQTMRPSRKRNFGHPALVNFLRDLARETHRKGFSDLLIGDMGMPRGGPTLSGHASHQTGLDVDIWLTLAPKGHLFTKTEREDFSALNMVVPEFEGLTKNWNPGLMEILKTAALSPQVQRMFVNPVIKKEVCRHYKGQAWVHKLRPWWFHEDHFHVRLFCQPGSALCEHQSEAEPGDGCDASLEEWFTPAMKEKERYMRSHPTPSEVPELPAECAKVLKEK